MKRFSLAIPLLAVALALGACGRTTGDRALSGAGIGAGVGLVSGALTRPDQRTHRDQRYRQS